MSESIRIFGVTDSACGVHTDQLCMLLCGDGLKMTDIPGGAFKCLLWETAAFAQMKEKTGFDTMTRGMTERGVGIRAEHTC